MTRPPAPPLSAAEAARVARCPAPENAANVEAAARAIWATVDDWPWEKASPEGQAYARRQAVAALSALPACPHGAAVARVQALIAAADEKVRGSVPRVGAEALIADGTHTVQVRDLRAALAGTDTGQQP